MTGASDPPGATELLQLDPLAPDHFRSRRNLDNGRAAIFGGQPLVQALAAATRTVPGWPAHSLTGYFLRAGVLALPIDYAVERVRDGRRFATRRVRAAQDGKPIFEMLCAFHDPEDGPAHAVPPADAPDPDTLPSLAEAAARHG